VIGLSLGVERQQYFGFPNFSSLFAAGETGVIFDPSTTGALYTTTAMTTPATPGDPVGMMLDQSQWGGAALGTLYSATELVTNGTFDTDTTGWTATNATTSVISGVARVTATVDFGRISQSCTTVVGKTYRVTAYELDGTSVGQVLVGTSAGSGGLGSGTALTFVATTTTSFVTLRINTAGGYADFDNISVREVTVANALAPIVGPELVTNGDFATATDWTLDNGGAGTVAITGGEFVAISAGNGARVDQEMGLVQGRFYSVTYTINSISGGAVRFFNRVNTGPDRTSPGTYTEVFNNAAARTTGGFQLVTLGVSATIDNISVKEIPGYHATQATAAKRPTYGIHPFGGRRNLTTASEDVSSNLSVSSGLSSVTSDSLTFSFAAYAYREQASGTVTGRTFTFSAVLSSATKATIGFRLNGKVTGPDETKTIIALTATPTRYSITRTFTSADVAIYFGFDNRLSGGFGDGIAGQVTISDQQFEESATATAYQKVTSQYVVTEDNYTQRRNLFTYSEDFSNAAWNKALTTATSGRAVATASTNIHAVFQDFSATTGVTYTYRQKLKYDNLQYASLRISAGVFPHVLFDLLNGTKVLQEAGATGTISGPDADGYYTCTATVTATSTLTGNAGVFLQDDTLAIGSGWTAVGTEAAFIKEAQLETGATATAYQPIVASFVSEFIRTIPSVHYLAFDGVDDAMVTPSIDFSGTDEMSVFAGLRRLSDATSGMVFETSTDAGATNGAINIGGITSGRYDINSRGTVRAQALATGFTPPLSSAITGIADISGASATLRIDGAQVATSAATQGTGNYGNYPLFIGARNQTSIYFNGHLYGLTVRGALTEPPTLSRAENLMAQKTGIEL
jgi:hypothetical protein